MVINVTSEYYAKHSIAVLKRKIYLHGDLSKLTTKCNAGKLCVGTTNVFDRITNFIKIFDLHFIMDIGLRVCFDH